MISLACGAQLGGKHFDPPLRSTWDQQRSSVQARGGRSPGPECSPRRCTATTSGERSLDLHLGSMFNVQRWSILAERQHDEDHCMKSRAPAAALLGLSLLFSTSYSLADDNVCVINNSSQDITASAGEGPDSNGVYPIGAKGGDQNKCWAFGTGEDAHYGIFVTWGGGAAAGNEISAGFTNPLIGAGYFNPSLTSDDEWPANEKICQGPLCIWHTDKSDVWRLYIEDAPASSADPCENLLSPDCQE